MQTFINSSFDHLCEILLSTIIYKANIHECRKDQKIGNTIQIIEYDNDYKFGTKTDCLHSCTLAFIITSII